MALNPRQQKFIAEYALGKSATQAYIAAGYSEQGAAQSAEKLLRKSEISSAVAALREKVAASAEITLESHLRELAELSVLARTAGQLSAAIQAEVSRGKVAGLYVEQTADMSGLTKEQRRERLLKLMA